MITKESIDRVLDADILEVLQKVLPHPAKKSGANYKALSPFTKENTGSFMISQSKNVWKCFSSGFGGVGAVSFIMKFQNRTWIEAITIVAELSNIILQYEEVDDEEKERQSNIESQRIIIAQAASKFRKYFIDLSEAHWAKKNILDRSYNDLTLEQFQVGYSVPNSNDLTAPLKEKARVQDGIDTGLIAKKEDRTFDFFNDRLMFPILDDRGRTIGFGGRASAEAIAKKSPKYLNTPDTIHYKKEFVLFGLFQARQMIVKYNKAYLSEGYTDVMGFHDKDVTNTVATCGTSLTIEHIKKLNKLCSHLVLVRDGDAAGNRATFRDIDLALEAGMKVSVVPMPSGEDPDSVSKAQKDNLQNWLDNNEVDALQWKASRLKSESKNPDDLSIAATELAETLLKIKDPIKRKAHAKDCAKKLGVSIKDFQDKIDMLLNLRVSKRQRDKETYEDEKYELLSYGFPEGGDVAQYKKDGYVLDPEEKAIYFYVENEKSKYFFKGANFVCNPLFVVRSTKGEGKRLIEFENSVGEKTVFSLNNKEVSNFAQFKEKIVDGYNFTFDGKTTNYHFTQFKNKLLYQFRTADELTTLGYQREGFFAFANGVVFNKNFYQVDDYGIVEVELLEEKQDDVVTQPYYKNMFYSPAFSKINVGNREDDDMYEGVRNFVYKESDINFNQWMMLFYSVYGKEKGMVGIGFAIASLFRSVILSQSASFPHLFLTGQRQSGKTTFAESITYLFTPNQKSFDLNSSSVVAFFRRVSRIQDIVVGLEEYTDQIQPIKFQSLKAAYDDRGRETGMATGDKNTSLVKIKSACIILSQYLSVIDGNSLTSRSITMNFLEQNYTEKQKTDFNRLKASEKKGMTSLIVELIKYRHLIERELAVTIEELNRQLMKDLKDEYMDRVLENFTKIMAPVKILFNKFVFPFKWEEYYKYCLETIVTTSDVINETDGTAMFWNVLEYLVDQKQINKGIDFMLEPKPIFDVWPKKNEKLEIVNKAGDNILFLRLGKVHQDYVNAVSKRKNEEPIGEATLRGYFKSKPYYIGAVKSMHFETGSGSCYAFNYSMMERMGVLNIVRDFKNKTNDEPDIPEGTFEKVYNPSNQDHDDLPY